MGRKVQQRGGTTAEHSSFTGAIRETTVDTTKNTVIVHDGFTPGGHALATESKLNDEITIRTNAVNAVDTKVTTEKGRIDTLNGDATTTGSVAKAVSDEVTNRTNAVNAVDSKVNTEVTNRTNAVNAVDSKVTTEKGRIDAILAATDADKDTFAEIVTLVNSVDTANDDALAGYVTTNNSRSAAIEQSVADEAILRTNAIEAAKVANVDYGSIA